MAYVLNLFYVVVLILYLPILLFQRVFQGKKRPGLWTKLTGRVPARKDLSRPCIWIHAVSLGEVNVIRSLVTQIQSETPNADVVISTSTTTGYEAAQKHFDSHWVVLFPFDFTWAIRNVLRRIRPSMLVLTELEIWPNLLAECQRQKIRTTLINGRLSAAGFRKYQRLRFVFGAVFRSMDLVCARNERVAERFEELGVDVDRVVVTGNMKFDQLNTDRRSPEINQIRQLAKVSESDVIFLAGSTQDPEEEIAIQTFLKLKDRFGKLRLFLCPRHPERFEEVARMLKSHQLPFVRRSLVSNVETGGENDDADVGRVWLLDTLGELKNWWGVCDIAFVGGSFGNRGGQNMLEPAAFGAAVCFGPNTQNYAEEVESLLEANAAVKLRHNWELTDFVERCCDARDLRETLGDNAQNAIQRHLAESLSATEKTIQMLVKCLANSPMCKFEAAAA